MLQGIFGQLCRPKIEPNHVLYDHWWETVASVGRTASAEYVRFGWQPPLT